MKKIFLALIAIIPFTTFAQIRNIDSSSATSLVESISAFVNEWLIPLMVLGALAFFLIGVIQYIKESDDSKREDRKQKIFWGLIGLLVMLSVWSLVFVISGTFNVFTGGSLAQ